MHQGEAGVIARRRPYAGAVVLLVIGLLTGCGAGAPEPVDASPASTRPRPSPTVFPLPTETTDPEPQAPEWDPALNEPTLDNAFAFGEYFMDLYSYTLATGDTERWSELSHPECIFCASVVDLVDQGNSGHTRIRLTPISGELIGDEHFAVNYTLDQWVDGVVDEIDHTAYIDVLSVDGRWQMRAIQIDEHNA